PGCRRLPSPTLFRSGHVVEVGAGRGELLARLWRAAARRGLPLQLTGLDVVDRPSGLPPEVAWWSSPGGAALPRQLRGLHNVLVEIGRSTRLNSSHVK